MPPLRNCVFTVTWTNRSMTEDEYGGVHDSYLTITLTFHIDRDTAAGFYRLDMSGKADSATATFLGWDHQGISVRLCGYCLNNNHDLSIKQRRHE